MQVARITTTHELYHAVQGAFANERKQALKLHSGNSNPSRQACADTARLFASIYEEGSAMAAEDPMALAESHSDLAARQIAEMREGLAHLARQCNASRSVRARNQCRESCSVRRSVRRRIPWSRRTRQPTLRDGASDRGERWSARTRSVSQVPPVRIFIVLYQTGRIRADRDHPKTGAEYAGRPKPACERL